MKYNSDTATYYKLSIFILLIFSYSFYKQFTFEKSAIYTIAKATNWKSAEQGSSCYMDVYYRSNIYKVELSSLNCSIGKFYIVGMFEGDPQSALIVCLAPDCLLKNKMPNDGWKAIPNCDSVSVK